MSVWLLLAKPVVQSINTRQERLSIISHTPCVLAFNTHILCIKGIEIFFVRWILYTFDYIFFNSQFSLLRYKSWWNMPLKRHNVVTMSRTVLLLCCQDCYCMQQHHDLPRFDYGLWRHTMHEWVMAIHYQTGIAQGRFANIILPTNPRIHPNPTHTPHPRNNGACLIHT